MALRHLQGPIPLVWETGIPLETQGARWVDQYGLLMTVLAPYNINEAPVHQYAIGHLNGECYARTRILGASPDTPVILDQQAGGLLSFHAVNPSVPETWSIYNYDAVIGRAIELLHADAPSAIRVRAAGRYLHANVAAQSGISIRSTPLGGGQTVTEELEDTQAVSGSLYYSLGEAARLHIATSTGYIYTYDTIVRKLYRPRQRIPLTNKGLWYSREMDIYISLHVGGSGEELNLWADQEEPATLTAPVALDLPAAGSVVRLQTTVKGAEGVPVDEIVVGWTLLAGLGQLESTTSMTDLQGRAANRLILPQNSEGESTTVQVTVLY